MSDQSRHLSWWKLILTGLLAIAFGIAAMMLPAGIMFGRILDIIFGEAKPPSGGMTAVAALLALVALVAIDGLVHLFGTGVVGKPGAWIRGVIGVATAIAAIFWPGATAYVAVQLIGLSRTANRCRACLDRDWHRRDDAALYRRGADQRSRWHCGRSSRTQPDHERYFGKILSPYKAGFQERRCLNRADSGLTVSGLLSVDHGSSSR